MKYTDMEIVATGTEVVKDAGEKQVRFKLQVPGVINEPIDGSYDAVKLQELCYAVEMDDPGWQEVGALGLFLGQALLPEAVRDALSTRTTQAKAQGEGVRLRLMLSGNELNRQPWEFMLLNRGGGEAKPSDFLALNPNVSIVRHPATALPAWKVEASQPARMTVALASPGGQGLAPLNVAKEHQIIEQAVAGKRVKVTWVDRAKAGDLPDRQHPAHLFHFAGHGTFDRVEAVVLGTYEGKGNLVLDDGTGDPVYLSAETVAVQLASAGVRVAVLGACLTAQGDDVSVWGSVAESLLKAELGAVVGMQYAVRDASAIAFADKFYATLLSGLTIDEAVSAGRIAVLTKDDVRGWATPVLFLRAPDGLVFPEYANDPQLKAERDQVRLEADVDIDEISGLAIVIKAGNVQSGILSAKAKVTKVKKGGTFVGVQAGDVGGGSVNVEQTANKVEGEVIGASLDSFGAGGNH
jgi:hypothetical protein